MIAIMSVIALAPFVVKTNHALAIFNVDQPVFVGVRRRGNRAGYFPDHHSHHRAIIKILLEPVDELGLHVD
jgi:hypothetical protein